MYICRRLSRRHISKRHVIDPGRREPQAMPTAAVGIALGPRRPGSMTWRLEICRRLNRRHIYIQFF